MLQFGSRTITVDGVTVYSDHADPNQFWYLPGPVDLSRRPEDGRPDLTFIKYKKAAVDGGAKGGGFLMFTADLSLEEDLERKILNAVQAEAPDTPKLSVVPFDSGTVECIALDLQGSGGTTSNSQTPGSFVAVEEILGATQPSLQGNNTAAFSLTLSADGATIMEKALEARTTPIGVLYQLKFTGLRPSLDVEVTADYTRIYQGLRLGLGLDLSIPIKGIPINIKADIDAIFEKLVEDGAIHIKVINFSTDEDIKSKEKWALDFFKDEILKDWFKPTLTPRDLLKGEENEENPSGGGNSPGGGGQEENPSSGGQEENPGSNEPEEKPSGEQEENPGSGEQEENPSGEQESPGSGEQEENPGGSEQEGAGSGAQRPPLVSSDENPVVTEEVPPNSERAAARLETQNVSPSDPTGSFRLVHTPSSTGNRETIRVLGGENPVVQVDGQVRQLNAERELTLDVVAGQPARSISVTYPERAELRETFHLYFSFDRPEVDDNLDSYVNNSPSPTDNVFLNGGVGPQPERRTGNADELRTWLQNQLANPRQVRLSAHASFEGNTAKQRHNQLLSERRLQVARGIIGTLATIMDADPQGHTRAQNGNRSGDWRDRVVEIEGVTRTASPARTIQAEISRPQATTTPEGPSEEPPEEPSEGGNEGQTPPENENNEGNENNQNNENNKLPGLGVSVAFTMRFVKTEELRTRTLRYTRTDAVQESYNPQGFFGLLLGDFERSQHFVEVDLDSPFFRQFAVSASAPIDYERIGLTSAHVSLDYGSPSDPENHRHGDFVFDRSSSLPEKFAVFMNESLDTEYQYAVQYHFDPTSDWEGEHFTYDSGPITSEDRTLLLNPHEVIGFHEISIFPNRIDEGIVDLTHVHLNYSNSSGWTRTKTLMVNPDSEAQFWKLRLSNPQETEFTYQFVHHLKNGSIIEEEPVTSSVAAIPVNDPFESALALEFVPLWDTATTRMVFLDVEYEDVENDYRRTERFRLDSHSFESVKLRIALLDSTRRSYRYRTTFVSTDNQIQRDPFIVTEETLIFLQQNE